MATDRGVLTMEENLSVLQLVDKVKAIFDTNLVCVNYLRSGSGFTNLDDWLITFSSKCSLKSYLLTIDPDQLTDEQTKYLIETVFGDNKDDICENTIVAFKPRRVLELILEDESVFYDKVMSMLFSLYGF